MNELALIRAAAVTPVVRLANPKANAGEILDCIRQAQEEGAALAVFPELCLTGCTAKDLFEQEFLYQKQMEALQQILEGSRTYPGVVVLGLYLRLSDRYQSCAAVLQRGSVLGVVPKDRDAGHRDRIILFRSDVPFGDLLFEDPSCDFRFGVEVSEDLYGPAAPAEGLCLAGAHLICCPFAEAERIAAGAYRKQTVLHRSAAGACAYVLAAAGATESTTDAVFAGHSMIAECGDLLAEQVRFSRSRQLLLADIDHERVRQRRIPDPGAPEPGGYTILPVSPLPLATETNGFLRAFSPTPFIPADKAKADANCAEAFAIQTAALAGRFAHTGSRKALIGVSGGLDSTLALLVTSQAFRSLGKSSRDIVAVTMPGFGTTDGTYNNALAIMEALGTDLREIPIRAAVLQHFRDIGHDPDEHTAVFENAQARERTQILMDLANKENGLHVGTGDLSEEALGWCTYNGDHMAMYNVNVGIPKTFIRLLVKWIIDTKLTGPSQDTGFSRDNARLAEALQSILDTPVSPELLPPDANGDMTQKTEDKVGPYVLHDFFVYHTVRDRVPPRKLLAMACLAFAGTYDEPEIRGWLRLFYRRFFTQQFKRNCTPDGPGIGTVSLSPFDGWSMASDADGSLWLEALEEALG